MEMKPEARVACQVMLAVLFAALLITAIAFAGECRSFSLTVQAFQPHAQPCFQCPFDWIRYRGKCYYFSEVEGNWTSSQDNCSALGASLAMLDSTEDLSFVMRYKGISEHWIGLLREDEEQPWLWVNRSPLSHLRAAWPQQPHKTPVLTLARDSSLGAEGTKAPQEAMGETTQAVVMKTFGGPDETCEEMSEAERCCIKAEFERLRRLRAEWERAVLRRLAELDGTFAATQAEKSLQVAEGVAQLHRLIRQLEAKCLPQDVGRILSSLSEMRLHLPSGLPKQLEKSLSSCCHQSDALWEALEKFRGRREQASEEHTRVLILGCGVADLSLVLNYTALTENSTCRSSPPLEAAAAAPAVACPHTISGHSPRDRACPVPLCSSQWPSPVAAL